MARGSPPDGPPPGPPPVPNGTFWFNPTTQLIISFDSPLDTTVVPPQTDFPTVVALGADRLADGAPISHNPGFNEIIVNRPVLGGATFINEVIFNAASGLLRSPTGVPVAAFTLPIPFP